jgi:hypothetical protein
MQDSTVCLELGMRVWQDERLNQAWRVAYREGDDETVVTFPDAAAMGDFIAERFGLALFEEPARPTRDPRAALRTRRKLRSVRGSRMAAYGVRTIGR